MHLQHIQSRSKQQDCNFYKTNQHGRTQYDLQ